MKPSTRRTMTGTYFYLLLFGICLVGLLHASTTSKAEGRKTAASISAFCLLPSAFSRHCLAQHVGGDAGIAEIADQGQRHRVGVDDRGRHGLHVFEGDRFDVLDDLVGAELPAEVILLTGDSRHPAGRRLQREENRSLEMQLGGGQLVRRRSIPFDVTHLGQG